MILALVTPVLPKEKQRREPLKRLTGESEKFDVWWSLYPRKAAKVDARKAFPKAIARIAAERKITPDSAFDWLAERTREFSLTPKGQAGKHCPYPATWLNGARFDDDPATWLETSGNNKPKTHTGYSHSGANSNDW